MRKHEKNQPRNEWRALFFAQCCACCLEKLAVRNARGTRRLARPAAEAAVDVRVNLGVVRLDRALEQRAHKEYPAARTLIFILEREIRRTRLKTKAAMHALVDSRKRRCKRAVGKCTCRYRVGWRRTLFFENGETQAGPRMPGFNSR